MTELADRRRPAEEHRLAPAVARSSGAAWSSRTASAAACVPAPRSCASPSAGCSSATSSSSRARRSTRWRELSGETINLACPARAGVEHLLQVDGRHFLGAGQWVGRTVDFHCTANGKVFLAFGRALAPAGASTLTSRTRQATIIGPDALQRRARPGPQRRLRGRRGRVGARAGGDRGAGARRQRRGGRGAQHHRPDRADDAGADPGAVAGTDPRSQTG